MLADYYDELVKDISRSLGAVLETYSKDVLGVRDVVRFDKSFVSVEPSSDTRYLEYIDLDLAEGKYTDEIVPVLTVDFGRFGSIEIRGRAIPPEFSNMLYNYVRDELEGAVRHAVATAVSKYNMDLIRQALENIAAENSDICQYNEDENLLTCEVREGTKDRITVRIDGGHWYLLPP